MFTYLAVQVRFNEKSRKFTGIFFMKNDLEVTNTKMK